MRSVAALPRANHALCRVRGPVTDRKSTRLNSSHSQISYAVFCLKKKNKITPTLQTQTNAPKTASSHIHLPSIALFLSLLLLPLSLTHDKHSLIPYIATLPHTWI